MGKLVSLKANILGLKRRLSSRKEIYLSSIYRPAEFMQHLGIWCWVKIENINLLIEQGTKPSICLSEHFQLGKMLSVAAVIASRPFG